MCHVLVVALFYSTWMLNSTRFCQDFQDRRVPVPSMPPSFCTMCSAHREKGSLSSFRWPLSRVFLHWFAEELPRRHNSVSVNNETYYNLHLLIRSSYILFVYQFSMKYFSSSRESRLRALLVSATFKDLPKGRSLRRTSLTEFFFAGTGHDLRFVAWKIYGKLLHVEIQGYPGSSSKTTNHRLYRI